MPLASYDNPWDDDGDDPPFRYPECETPGCTNRVYARTDVYCRDCQQERRDQHETIMRQYVRKFFSKQTA